MMNEWAVLSLMGTLINGSLGLYVYSKGPDRHINRAFLLIVIPGITWTFSEFLLRSTIDPALAELLSKISYASISLAPVTWVNMVYNLLDYNKKIYDFVLYILLVVGIFFSLTILSTDLIISGVVNRYWGYTGNRSTGFIVFTVFYSTFMFYTLVPLIRKYRDPTLSNTQKIKYGFFSIGLAIPIILGTTSQIILPVINIDVLPIASVSTVFMSIFFSIGIVKYNIFSIDPAEETHIRSEKKYELIEGNVYSIREEIPSKVYDIFTDQTSYGYKGLIFSRFDSETVRARYNIKRSPIIWNTYKQGGDNVKPESTEIMEKIILEFVKRSNNPILLLESFEQIVKVTGINKSITFLKDMEKMGKKYDFPILIMYNSKIFEEDFTERINQITREVEVH